MKKTKSVQAWADVGSSGGIFEFVSGPVAGMHPNLMHVYAIKHPGLTPVTIAYEIDDGRALSETDPLAAAVEFYEQFSPDADGSARKAFERLTSGKKMKS